MTRLRKSWLGVAHEIRTFVESADYIEQPRNVESPNFITA